MERIKEFFKLDGSFLSFMEKLMWVFIINLIFLVCCIPVVTIGAAAKAMYKVMFKLVEDRKLDLISEYFSTFFRNMFTSIKITVTLLVLLIISVINIFYFFWMDSPIGYILMGISILIFLALFCIALCMFPIMALYDGKYKETIVSTLDFIKNYPCGAISVLLVTVGFIGATVLIATVPQLYIFAYLLFIIVGLCAFVTTYIVHSKLVLKKADDEEVEEE